MMRLRDHSPAICLAHRCSPHHGPQAKQAAKDQKAKEKEAKEGKDGKEGEKIVKGGFKLDATMVAILENIELKVSAFRK